MTEPEAARLRILAAIAASAVMIAGCGTATDAATKSSAAAISSTTAAAAPSESPTLTLAYWGRDHFAPALDDVGDALVWIGGAMQGMDFTDIRAGGRALDAAVEKLAAVPPSPDDAVNTALESAGDNLSQLAIGAQRINPGTSSAELDTLAAYRDEARRQLDIAVMKVQAAQREAG